VHDTSLVIRRAPAVAAVSAGMIAAVHTSFGERYRLKSRTSALVLPSRARTFSTFACAVLFTTEM
jgi:hypothetical protein